MMFKPIIPRYVSVTFMAMLVSGCATMAPKTQTDARATVPQVKAIPMDADIQRILSAGGIDPAGPAAVAIASSGVIEIPSGTPVMSDVPQPPPIGSATAMASLPAPDGSAQLAPGALSLPAPSGSSRDFMGNFNLPASVNAGMLPTPDMAPGRVIEITGPNAQEIPKAAARAKKPPVPAARPSKVAPPVLGAGGYQTQPTNLDGPNAHVKRF